MNILRVNMEHENVAFEDLPDAWKLTGGSGLIAKIMAREVSPDADPLGPQNKLIIAAGPLAGTMAPQLGRISVGAKSPLTYGIKEANAGGPAAQKLDKLNIRAIIVESAPRNGKMYCLSITHQGVSLTPGDLLKGMKIYQLTETPHTRYGKQASIIGIGIGGERQHWLLSERKRSAIRILFLMWINPKSTGYGKGWTATKNPKRSGRSGCRKCPRCCLAPVWSAIWAKR